MVRGLMQFADGNPDGRVTSQCRGCVLFLLQGRLGRCTPKKVASVRRLVGFQPKHRRSA
jgi:hypothetical protein